jgi:hypothetical protein
MLSRTDTVRALAEKISTDFFICMLNPKYRGPKFKFSTFEIEDWVIDNLGVQIPWNTTKAQQEEARRVARAYWNRWIKTIGDGLPKKAR